MWFCCYILKPWRHFYRLPFCLDWKYRDDHYVHKGQFFRENKTNFISPNIDEVLHAYIWLIGKYNGLKTFDERGNNNLSLGGRTVQNKTHGIHTGYWHRVNLPGNRDNTKWIKHWYLLTFRHFHPIIRRLY